MIQAILFHITPECIAAAKTEVIADTGVWFLYYYYFYYFSFLFSVTGFVILCYFPPPTRLSPVKLLS